MQGGGGAMGPCFVLTDPVVHKTAAEDDTTWKVAKPSEVASERLGRTDLMKRGIDSFFDTHQCNKVCKLLNLKHRDAFFEEEDELLDEVIASQRAAVEE